jgi:hypothetical protein
MKVGLIDVDGHNFPNLPLMKISTYHKSKGDSVEWYEPLFSGEMDRVYMSKVFTFTPDYQYCINAKEILKGGTGYNYPSGGETLTDEIEHIYPDYEIYGIKDTAYGFLTRGCPRNCEFCIVGKKEGLKSQKVADLNEFWNDQKFIKLLDPNILAAKGHKNLLKQLSESGAWVDFTQGLDARLLTEEDIDLIKRIKIKNVHFAWDNIGDEKAIVPKLKLFKEKTKLDKRKITVYVLTNFNSTFEEDLHRIYTLRGIGVAPYIMIYEKQTAPKEIKNLQRWVNNRIIWYSNEKATFEEYKENTKRKRSTT